MSRVELTHPQSLLVDALFRVGTDARAQDTFEGYSGRRVPTVDAVLSAGGNHAFDNCPQDFGITEHEGHCIRAMLQEGQVRDEPGFQESIEMLIGFTQAMIKEERAAVL